MSKLDVQQNATSSPSSSPKCTDRTAREETVDDFSPDWCQKLLNDPSYRHTTPRTRVVGGTHGPSFNSLMGRTLFTDHTIRAMKFMYKPGHQATGTTGELLALISLGGEVCSHAGVLHGGMCTTIFDEVAGGLAGRESQKLLMAVNFNVNLRKSVKAPGILLVRAWIERPQEGRKIWVKGRFEQDGVECFDGEGMWLEVEASPRL